MKVILVIFVVALSFKVFAVSASSSSVSSSSATTIARRDGSFDVNSASSSVFVSSAAAIDEMVIDIGSIEEGQEGDFNTISVSTSFPANGIEHIIFSGSLSKISFAESAANSIEIEYAIYTDMDNIDQGNQLAESILHQKRDTSDILVSSRIVNYSCAFARATVNGSVTQSVSGACYGDIVVKLPSQSNILIFHDSDRIN